MLCLLRERYSQNKLVVMSDIAVLVASVKTTLLEIAKQTQALGVGLQNAAPGDKLGSPNNSVQYLCDVSENLTDIAKKCEAMLGSDDVGPRPAI